MPQRPIGVTDVSPGGSEAHVRTREHVVGADTVVEQYVIPVSVRVRSFRGSVSSFIITGTSAANHVLLTIFNVVGSGVLVAVSSLATLDVSTGGQSIMRRRNVQFLAGRPTGGTSLAPVPWDSALTHNANVEILAAASADTVASAITATLDATNIPWGGEQERYESQAGQHLFRPRRFIPFGGIPNRLTRDEDPIILTPGQGIAVTVGTASTGNTASVVHAVLEEFTLP